MDELTASFKYIFLDIVKFTKRSVEAQSDVIKELNKIVKESVQDNSLQKDNTIFIPTGDGICLAMRGELSYDIHMLISLDILAKIQGYNENQSDNTRKFGVRMGINENVDNVIEDINGRTNVAGSGINFASRIMDNADEGQILVSQTVYDILYAREKYMNSFRSYNATIKHDLKIPVHQYIKSEHKGLNVDIPSTLSSKKIVYALSKTSAYYFAHAISNKELLIKKTGKDSQNYHTPVILLWFLAHDSHEMATCKEFDSAYLKQPGRGKLSIEEQFDVIEKTDLSILMDFANTIVNSHLDRFHSQSFEENKYGMKCWFMINKDGQVKLKKEYPDIWQEFSLDDYI
ncbi:MAG: adenylate/guanylate cyclase domain-containing protein [Candidatus Roizmanbacteria bacterium]|nr:adenylate/guanylate cyclase domain-containing protein [Candidatus Roizmanbacteria bacterium]